MSVWIIGHPGLPRGMVVGGTDEIQPSAALRGVLPTRGTVSVQVCVPHGFLWREASSCTVSHDCPWIRPPSFPPCSFLFSDRDEYRGSEKRSFKSSLVFPHRNYRAYLVTRNSVTVVWTGSHHPSAGTECNPEYSGFLVNVSIITTHLLGMWRGLMVNKWSYSQNNLHFAGSTSSSLCTANWLDPKHYWWAPSTVFASSGGSRLLALVCWCTSGLSASAQQNPPKGNSPLEVGSRWLSAQRFPSPVVPFIKRCSKTCFVLKCVHLKCYTCSGALARYVLSRNVVMLPFPFGMQG